MDVKEYIEKHNINVPLEAVEEFEQYVQNVIGDFQNDDVVPQKKDKLSSELALLLTMFRDKYKTSPIVTDSVRNATGVLSWFAIDETDKEHMVIIPIFDNAYPIERISINAPDGKCKTETVIEDQTPVLAKEVAKLELQAKFESYSKKRWAAVNDGLPVRFIGFLKNSEQPFVVAKEFDDGGESVFTLREDLRMSELDECPLIKETGPYADWPMDAKVKYWDGAYERHAHYAGTDENGNATVWRSWGTSWTTQERFCPEFVELAED